MLLKGLPQGFAEDAHAAAVDYAHARQSGEKGMVDEFLSRAVEKFVDHAFLAGLPRVRIVHGSGMGILRKALRQALQQHPHVESVAEPAQNEGGGGATVVELRV